jgi:CDP-2,3-bis-(O-geranylgeranyl)-sn-glycerol synthase
MDFQFLISCFYFFLPAYFANMAPTIVRKLGVFKFLEKPVDFNKKFFGQPIFGLNKTWRGVIFGMVFGTLICKILFFLHRIYQFPFYRIVGLDYQKIEGFYFGFLISFLAVLGDLFFSFIKRRLKMEPGKRFLPFDQTNYVISNALILGPIFKISLNVWITIFFLTFFLHTIVNFIGYLLGISRSKW